MRGPAAVVSRPAPLYPSGDERKKLKSLDRHTDLISQLSMHAVRSISEVLIDQDFTVRRTAGMTPSDCGPEIPLQHVADRARGVIPRQGMLPTGNSRAMEARTAIRSVKIEAVGCRGTSAISSSSKQTGAAIPVVVDRSETQKTRRTKRCLLRHPVDGLRLEQMGILAEPVKTIPC
jgi:hypothetical protein